MALHEPTLEQVRDARAALAGRVRETPVIDADWLETDEGHRVLLKTENLQLTGSFKIRGTTAKLDSLDESELASGVVAGSAGNHGQALACAAARRGVSCDVFMPMRAPVVKVEAVRRFGGEVHLGADSVDECVERAREFSERTGSVFVHPFDDPAVLVGQGTIGLELLDQVPDLARVVFPIGGGGLGGAAGSVIKRVRPEVEVIGVQVDGYAPYWNGEAAVATPNVQLADGIAIKRPGLLTAPLVDHYFDSIEVVSEASIRSAMVELLIRAHLVVEGGGAVGVAAVLDGVIGPGSKGPTVVVLSGGNVDTAVISMITRIQEAVEHRRLRLFSVVPDRPGGLAGLLNAVADEGVDLIDLDHVRDDEELELGETGIDLTVAVRDEAHGRRLLDRLRAAGFPCRTLTR